MGRASVPRRQSWTGQVSLVTPWLLLSGARAVKPNRLKELGIDAVVNATAELPQLQIEGVEVYAVPVEDSPNANLLEYLHPIADKLESLRKSGKTTLVHCVAGVSRSPSLILAYMVKHMDLNLRDAFALLKEARPVVRPRGNFFKQLIQFETEVRGQASVTLVPIPGIQLAVPDVCVDEIKMLKGKCWTDMIKERRNIERLYH